VATSDGGGGGPLLRYLGSRANIIGSVGGLAALGAHIGLVTAGTGGLGAFWPVAVAGIYGLGAVLAPRSKVDLHVGSGEVAVEQLGKDLDALRRKVERYGGKLPGDVTAATRGILDTLSIIIKRGQTLAGNAEGLFVVSRTIRDYLPTSLESYLNLPRTYAMQRRVDGRRTAHEELLAQLGLLQAELTKIADGVFENDAKSLADQGRFLEERFRKSELDLN